MKALASLYPSATASSSGGMSVPIRSWHAISKRTSSSSFLKFVPSPASNRCKVRAEVEKRLGKPLEKARPFAFTSTGDRRSPRTVARQANARTVRFRPSFL